MKILMISTDKKILNDDSDARRRMVEYGKLADELHIIIFSKRGSGEKQNFDNVFLYPTNSLTRWCCIKDAVKIGKKIAGINLVTAQDPFETGLASFCLAKRLKAKLQLQIHTDFLSPYFWRESFLNKARVLLAKFLISRADCVRVVSERIQKSLNAKRLTPNADVLPVFVDVAKIQDAPVKTDLHQKYPQFDFIILMASRLTREKNIGMAVEAMAEVVKKYPKTGLVIVGEGPEKRNYELRIMNYGLENNIIIESWSDDLPSYQKTADLFLLTSNYEGYGRTVIEAMAVGCPAVMTDVGLAGDILKNGQNGIVIPIDDKDGLIEAIYLMKDAERRKSFAENAQKTISVFYDKEEYLTRYKKSWTKCL